MKLFQLRYFCEACRHKNITRAAAALHVSQPAVTMAVQALESEFGLKLIERGERGFSLTADGEFFYREAQALISRGDALSEAMDERRRLGEASLRFGSTPMAGAGITRQLFLALGKGRAPLSVNLLEGGRAQLLRLLDDDLLDFALMPTEGLPAGEWSSLALGDCEIVLCAHTSMPCAKLKRLESARQLEGVPLAFFDEKFYLNELVFEFFRKEDVEPTIICRSGQIFTVVEFVRSGAAAAFLNRGVADSCPDIAQIPLARPLSLKIGFVWKKTSSNATGLEREIRRLTDELRSAD
ncbi:MAG: LysR family transcriptional regulator [Pyramidobacter sp.]|nr:LysR family transcriptional regulator [Pyramidobacter sp.]